LYTVGALGRRAAAPPPWYVPWALWVLLWRHVGFGDWNCFQQEVAHTQPRPATFHRAFRRSAGSIIYRMCEPVPRFPGTSFRSGRSRSSLRQEHWSLQAGIRRPIIQLCKVAMCVDAGGPERARDRDKRRGFGGGDAGERAGGALSRRGASARGARRGARLLPRRLRGLRPPRGRRRIPHRLGYYAPPSALPRQPAPPTFPPTVPPTVGARLSPASRHGPVRASAASGGASPASGASPCRGALQARRAAGAGANARPSRAGSGRNVAVLRARPARARFQPSGRRMGPSRVPRPLSVRSSSTVRAARCLPPVAPSPAGPRGRVKPPGGGRRVTGVARICGADVLDNHQVPRPLFVRSSCSAPRHARTAARSQPPAPPVQGQPALVGSHCAAPRRVLLVRRAQPHR
jgi:hypothetical protein